VSPANGSPSDARGDAGRQANATPKIIRQNQAVRETGKTYGQLSALWWQYVLSIPPGQNPLLDETGAFCSQGQSAPAFFLVGTFTTVPLQDDVLGRANRSECKVPAGKPLFIPILNAECSTIEGNGETEEALRGCANGFVDPVSKLSLEVDGKKVPGLIPGVNTFRAESPLFTFNLPIDNLLGESCPPPGQPAGTPPLRQCPPGPSQAVADGYYVLLEPLSPGSHTIRIQGETPTSDGHRFILDVTYKPLVVSPS
jgi:hypothetical protein